ncbi:MAG: hypothetical protein IJ176_06980 [Prevotella sp.]|nr:hypothetical protein [Prevotella sp.]
MKTLRYTSFATVMAALLAGGTMTSCSTEDLLMPDYPYATGSLELSPRILGMSQGSTRAVDENEITKVITDLHEDYMGQKLDVFVVGNGTSNATFFNRYSIPAAPVNEQYYLLERNWKHVQQAEVNNQQYVVGDPYKLYALVNYEGPAITTLDELKQATVGYRNSGDDTYALTNDIFKWYNPSDPSGSRFNGWTNQKLFAMDGSTEFTFAATDDNKQIDVDMKRATAKIVLDLKMDPEFLKKLIREETDASDNTVQFITAGNPRFRPVGFNYHAYAVGDIEGREALEPVSYIAPNMYNVLPTNVTDDTEVTDPKREYQLNTYCYPFSWSDNELEKTPTIVVSFGINSKGNTEYYYYTIPITQKSVKELKRNYVYHIDATITGFGAKQETDQTEEVLNLKYDVIDWAEYEQEISIVDVVNDVEFLMVDPIEEKMFGANPDPAVIHYYAAMGAPVKWAIQEVYYYNSNNQKVTYKTNANFWSGATLAAGQGSTFTVSSDVLANHAVKFIKIRVWLDSDNDGTFDNGEKYQDVVVKHFPLQSIQNISGLWSTRYNRYRYDNAANKTTTINTIEYSYDPVDDGWDTYSTGTSNNRANNPPDGLGWTYVNGTGWRRYYRNVTKEVANVTGYTSNTSNSGNHWIFADTHVGSYTGGNNSVFEPHIYYNNYNNNGAGQVYYLTSNQGERGDATGTGHINNHMYVIQITEASNTYTIGSPILNDNYLSNNNVVAPAFMIASQLGVTSTTGTATTAATHCSQYMEVGLDGKRYVGWRLPTAAEINVIVEYQSSGWDTIDRVLRGRYYWTLAGTRSDQILNYSSGGTDSYYIRCVRELTPEEVVELNNKSK